MTGTTMKSLSTWIATVSLLLILFSSTASTSHSSEPVKAGDSKADFRVGIVGLDTSHVIHFTTCINGTVDQKGNSSPGMPGIRVVAAYPQGSADIESSVSRVPKYTEQLRGEGIKIVASIEELLGQVDGVLLETNDGRPHLEQVRPVIAAGKPVFVDKPLAGSLREAVAIFALARQANVPLFSASSLRFSESTQAVAGGAIGNVMYCETSSPCKLEKTHPDLFWYGIHGVESLFTVLGTGCETVERRLENGKIVVEGRWSNNRIGIFRESKGYDGLARSKMGEKQVGNYNGYAPLVDQIVEFFKTGEPPVGEAETLEIYTFMEAADESKRRAGQAVKLSDVLSKATLEAAKLIK